MKRLFIICLSVLSMTFIAMSDSNQDSSNVKSVISQLKPQKPNRERKPSSTIICHYENRFIWFEFDEGILGFETTIYDDAYNVISTDFVFDNSPIEISMSYNTLHIICSTEDEVYVGKLEL